jgi:HTH-type transcriptional regulator/antitoxin HigA
MWLRDFPVTELAKRDVLPAEPADKSSRVEQLLAFFGVATVGAWQDVYADLACAFRTTKAYEAEPGALAAWLRLGEIAAQDIYCEPYDRKRLEAALPRLRALTREEIDSAREQARDICAACGVAVIFIPELPGSRASGVARWLTPAKALVQLSYRYRTDDHLWFTLFHEIAHVLRHGKTDVWIEAASSPTNPREAEADSFACDVLIPRTDARELPGLKSPEDVQAFAGRIGIAPGIVVGRLQHDNLWPYSQGNQLKRQLSLAALADQ